MEITGKWFVKISQQSYFVSSIFMIRAGIYIYIIPQYSADIETNMLLL